MSVDAPGSNVIVTGSAGFIGRHVCRAYQARGWRVIGLVRPSENAEANKGIPCDITYPLDPRLFDGAETVLHLAGKAHALAETPGDRVEFFRVNTNGTRNVLLAARQAGVRRFVFLSSVKAMSRAHHPIPLDENGVARPWRETDFVEPDTPYGQSKLEAERLVLQGGFVQEPVVLRLCLVYGSGIKGNLQRMIEAVARNRFPAIPENGNRRSMVHAGDVVQAIMLAAERPEAVGQVFIVSDGRAYSSREVYKMICTALGKPVPSWEIPVWLLGWAARMGDLVGRFRKRRFIFDSDAYEKLLGSAWFSCSKIEAVLGYRPTWSLTEALPNIVEKRPLIPTSPTR